MGRVDFPWSHSLELRGGSPPCGFKSRPRHCNLAGYRLPLADAIAAKIVEQQVRLSVLVELIDRRMRERRDPVPAVRRQAPILPIRPAAQVVVSLRDLVDRIEAMSASNGGASIDQDGVASPVSVELR
jgi:hypothetical protein